MAPQAINLAYAENISPEQIHNLFMDRADVYAATQQPMMAFVDHLNAAKVHMHEQNTCKRYHWCVSSIPNSQGAVDVEQCLGAAFQESVTHTCCLLVIVDQLKSYWIVDRKFSFLLMTPSFCWSFCKCHCYLCNV